MGPEIDNRQFFYNCRNAVKVIDPSKDFSQQTFTTHLNAWQEEFGAIDGLCKKARGFFVEPHTGGEVPLGTRDVAQYIVPDYAYGSLLLTEKYGFKPIYKKHQIAERYDLGLIFNEGQSVDACKDLCGKCAEKGIKLFVLHDCDPYGYEIFDAMRREVECVDLSWTVDDCLALGKVPESDYRRHSEHGNERHGLSECIMPYLSPAALQLFKGERVRNEGPDGKPIEEVQAPHTLSVAIRSHRTERRFHRSGVGYGRHRKTSERKRLQEGGSPRGRNEAERLRHAG